MASDGNPAARAGRFLQGQITQDFAAGACANRPTYPNGDCTFFGCPPQTHIPGCGWTQQWGLCQPRQGQPQNFAGAAGPGIAATAIECNPSLVDACPTRFRCDTQPPTALCTQIPENCPTLIPEKCPTFCGPKCQTPQPGCTTVNCTQAGPDCPPQSLPPVCPDVSIGFTCTSVPPQCPGTNVLLDCTFGCTQFAPNCAIQITKDPACNQPAVGAAQPGGAGFQVAPTPATRCFICPPRTLPTYPNGDCTFFGCGPRGVEFVGAAQQQTAQTVCTQFSHQCQSAADGCPTRICQTYPNGDCTFFGCGPGGGGGTQFSQQCRSAVDACPTRLCGGGGGQAGAARMGMWPTPATRCFIC
jgi:hypothetical protein